ncbi:MAG: DUF1361 domain-containing protein [Bacteroidales bacterium]|nr:DUF1361 domain-containing protein [Bacteroidales bacterium]
MFRLLREKGRLNESLFLAAATILCFSISVFRFTISDTKMFLFLNWNLFLAFLPWAFTTAAIVFPKLRKSKIITIGVMAAWLLFFPNAPYILTDLFHLRINSNMPIWFDLALILTFAWTGLLFGFMSLWDIEVLLEKFINKKLIPIISVLLLFLGSFGIYVGRYLRWNSWDIIQEPYRLVYDIGHRVVNPLEHPRTWGMTIFMGVFLNLMYWSLRLIRKRKNISM